MPPQTRSGGVALSVETDLLPPAKRIKKSKTSTPATKNMSALRQPGATPHRAAVRAAIAPMPRVVATPRPMRRASNQQPLTIVKTLVDQKYSIEVVKIALTATISTIAWARKIFGRDEFLYDGRTIDINSSDLSYENFKNSSVLHPMAPRTDSMRDLFFLKRGSHKASDKLLTWLEGSAAEALEKGYLKAIQLNFHSPGGRSTQANIIEKYQIQIEHSLGTISWQINTEVLGATRSSEMATGLANLQLVELASDIRSRVEVEGTRFPKGTTMTLDMWLNENAPVGYQPLGFVVANSEFIPQFDGPESCLTMKTPFHSLSVYLPNRSQAIVDRKVTIYGPPSKTNQKSVLSSPHTSHTESPILRIDSLSGDDDNLGIDLDDDVQTQADNVEISAHMGIPTFRPNLDLNRDTQSICSSLGPTSSVYLQSEVLLQRSRRAGSVTSTEGTPSPYPPGPAELLRQRLTRSLHSSHPDSPSPHVEPAGTIIPIEDTPRPSILRRKRGLTPPNIERIRKITDLNISSQSPQML